MIDRVRVDSPDQIFVSDMSSVLGARNLTKYDLYDQYGVIFAGAHKNFGPSGLTFIMVRDDVMDRIYHNRRTSNVSVPMLMDWTKYHELGSSNFVNTPTSLTIYCAYLMCQYMLEQGGVDFFEEQNLKRAGKLFDVIDKSAQYKDNASPSDSGAFRYKCDIPKILRSTMNQAFTIDCVNPELNSSIEARFIKESRDRGFLGLKGHTLIGGLRATMYNSLPNESADALCDFMEDFQHTR